MELSTSKQSPGKDPNSKEKHIPSPTRSPKMQAQEVHQTRTDEELHEHDNSAVHLNDDSVLVTELTLEANGTAGGDDLNSCYKFSRTIELEVNYGQLIKLKSNPANGQPRFLLGPDCKTELIKR